MLTTEDHDRCLCIAERVPHIGHCLQLLRHVVFNDSCLVVLFTELLAQVTLCGVALRAGRLLEEMNLVVV